MKYLISFFLLVAISFSMDVNAQEINRFQSFDEWEKSISNEEGVTYVVNFWATWCKPCVAELPYFEQLNEKRNDVKVILVSLDFEQNIDKQVIPFLQKRNIQSQVDILLDQKANDWIDKVDPSWSGAIPATLLIKDSNKKFYEQSFHSLKELESVLF